MAQTNPTFSNIIQILSISPFCCKDEFSRRMKNCITFVKLWHRELLDGRPCRPKSERWPLTSNVPTNIAPTSAYWRVIKTTTYCPNSFFCGFFETLGCGVLITDHFFFTYTVPWSSVRLLVVF